MACEQVSRDPARHDVARGQLRGGVDVREEASARLVDDDRALPAERLGEQGHGVSAHGEGRRVELHELQICEASARARGHGQPVAGGLGGIGGVGVDAARASGRKHHGGGPVHDDRAIGVADHDPAGPAPFDEQIAGEGLLEHAHAWRDP